MATYTQDGSYINDIASQAFDASQAGSDGSSIMRPLGRNASGGFDYSGFDLLNQAFAGKGGQVADYLKKANSTYNWAPAIDSAYGKAFDTYGGWMPQRTPTSAVARDIVNQAAEMDPTNAEMLRGYLPRDSDVAAETQAIQDYQGRQGVGKFYDLGEALKMLALVWGGGAAIGGMAGAGAAGSAGAGTGGVAEAGAAAGTQGAGAGVPLMPPAGMPPAIPGSTSIPFTSASGATGTMVGTPAALGIADIAAGAGGVVAEQLPAPVEDKSRIFSPKDQVGLPSDAASASYLAKLLGMDPSMALMLGDIAGMFGGTSGITMSGGGLGNGAGGGGSGIPGFLGGVLNIGSGIYGLLERDRLKKIAERAFQAQDPFGSQRPGYQAQLAELMNNPNALTNMPGYQFGLDEGRRAIQRRGAADGSGGREAIALARYTPEYAMNFRNMELQRLAGLAGAGIAPSGGNVLMQGNAMASDIASRALASLGYGVRRM